MNAGWFALCMNRQHEEHAADDTEEQSRRYPFERRNQGGRSRVWKPWEWKRDSYSAFRCPSADSSTDRRA